MPTPEDSEFAAAVRRAGLTIPPDRWEAMRAAYCDMQALLQLLDDPLTYVDEPAVLPDLRPRGGR
ncbi:MAG TPA: hypothetical protein VME41_13565 [Stellaceae bacterium]|nr:hypothetical protein [Stellaceae bacterium]